MTADNESLRFGSSWRDKTEKPGENSSGVCIYRLSYNNISFIRRFDVTENDDDRRLKCWTCIVETSNDQFFDFELNYIQNFILNHFRFKFCFYSCFFSRKELKKAINTRNMRRRMNQEGSLRTTGWDFPVFRGRVSWDRGVVLISPLSRDTMTHRVSPGYELSAWV